MVFTTLIHYFQLLIICCAIYVSQLSCIWSTEYSFTPGSPGWSRWSCHHAYVHVCWIPTQRHWMVLLWWRHTKYTERRSYGSCEPWSVKLSLSCCAIFFRSSLAFSLLFQCHIFHDYFSLNLIIAVNQIDYFTVLIWKLIIKTVNIIHKGGEKQWNWSLSVTSHRW